MTMAVGSIDDAVAASSADQQLGFGDHLIADLGRAARAASGARAPAAA